MPDTGTPSPITRLGIVKFGADTLTLTAGNNYTGPTNIAAGTLQFSGSGTLGTGDVTNNGALVFNYTSGTTTVTNNIAGTGTLTKSGAGTVVLSGGSLSYTGLTTIQGGTLKAVGAGGLGLLAGNGGLDIQGGKAVLDYTGVVMTATPATRWNPSPTRSCNKPRQRLGHRPDPPGRLDNRQHRLSRHGARPPMPWAGRTRWSAGKTC